MTNNCNCGNPQFGFPCVCNFIKKNPGNNSYSCEFCGLYNAAIPRCNKCEHVEIEDSKIKEDAHPDPLHYDFRCE